MNTKMYIHMIRDVYMITEDVHSYDQRCLHKYEHKHVHKDVHMIRDVYMNTKMYTKMYI